MLVRIEYPKGHWYHTNSSTYRVESDRPNLRPHTREEPWICIEEVHFFCVNRPNNLFQVDWYQLELDRWIERLSSGCRQVFLEDELVIVDVSFLIMFGMYSDDVFVLADVVVQLLLASPTRHRTCRRRWVGFRFVTQELPGIYRY